MYDNNSAVDIITHRDNNMLTMHSQLSKVYKLAMLR